MNAPLSLRAAMQYVTAGLSVIPIATDGSKKPILHSWKEYMKRLPTVAEIREWFKQDVGIAIISGAVSGNLECLDIESEEAFQQWEQDVKQQSSTLWDKLVITETPGGKFDGQAGMHVRYRVSGECLGCGKLAMTEGGKTIAEIKGEGGYALAPGSPLNAHKDKKFYRNRDGHLISNVKTISEEERSILISAAMKLNKKEDKQEEYHPPITTEADGSRPGDVFNQRGDFSFLRDHGWKVVSSYEGKECWKRPGKEGPGISATTGFCRGKDGTSRLYVFSTNATPLQEGRCYSPFSAYAVLKHGGDFKEATRDIAGQLGLTTMGKVYVKSVPADLPQIEHPATDDTILFPIGVFPEPLQEIIEGIAAPLGCPTDSVGGLMLAMASVGIGYTRTILLEDGWAEIPSVYYVLVAYPGEGKSPILKKLAAPMYEWQKTLQEQFKASLEEYREQKEKHDINIENGVESKAPIKPKFPHVFTTDVTTEKLASILNDQPRGIAMLQDELVALVKGMNQYKAGGQGRDRQFYLEAWAGGVVKVDRKNEEIPILVHNPFITILGGIQPEMLGALRDEMGREDGFVHRFLFSYPRPRVLLPWGDRRSDPKHAAFWKTCFQRLTTLSQHVAPDGTMKPWACVRTPEADKVWKQWYDNHAIKTNQQDRPKRAVLFKNIAYAARLTLIMQMLRWACGDSQTNQQIEPESVTAGTWLADYFAGQHELVYQQLHKKADDIKAEELLEWIRKKGGMATVRNIMRTGPSWLRKSTDIIKQLQDLQDRGFGKYCENSPDKGGRKERWFEVTNEKDE